MHDSIAQPGALPAILGYHAHVYFDAVTVDDASRLCTEAARLFAVKMGRVHRQPVGPHPDWSCQLSFMPEVFGQIVPWLAVRRAGLVVLVHPLTGHELADHRDHAMWMGAMRTLDLSVLDPG